jgi:hypothetical protein
VPRGIISADSKHRASGDVKRESHLRHTAI